MKKFLVSLATVAFLAACTQNAQAHDRDTWLGPAVAGVVIGSILANRPYVVMPQPTYVAPPVQYEYVAPQPVYSPPVVTYVAPRAPVEYREKTIIDPMCNCYRNILIPVY